MPLARWVPRSSQSVILSACSSLQQSLTPAPHSHSCTCSSCQSSLQAAKGARGLHTTNSPLRQSKPKVVFRDDVPPMWPYTGTKRENDANFRAQMREYEAQVGALRNEWRPLVDRHNKELERLKEERDAVRLEVQEENLKRQYDRWKVPTRLRTSQQIRSDPHTRSIAYARHVMRTSLTQVSRVAQAEVLLRESAEWVEPAKLGEAIQHALDNPTDLFLGGEPWQGTLMGVPEYVEGFEGPQVDRNTPEFVRRRKKKNRKKPAAGRPAW